MTAVVIALSGLLVAGGISLVWRHVSGQRLERFFAGQLVSLPVAARRHRRRPRR